MGTEEHVCPSCGQPVPTVVRRHKTLGAYVPVWGPGACRNPKCERFEGSEEAPRDKPGEPVVKGTESEPPNDAPE
ncbi:hypothetical protein [Streptomyces sp. NPDC002845]